MTPDLSYELEGEREEDVQNNKWDEQKKNENKKMVRDMYLSYTRPIYAGQSRSRIDDPSSTSAVTSTDRQIDRYSTLQAA